APCQRRRLMKRFTCLAVALALAAQARAADLDKIERRIAKEPPYQTKAPRYCLLVFGEDAAPRVWLVQDGDTLYVDRNGNGDLTEEGERVPLKQKDKTYRVFEAGNIKTDSRTHTGLSVTQRLVTEEEVANPKEMTRVKSRGGEPWVWSVGLTAERA